MPLTTTLGTMLTDVTRRANIEQFAQEANSFITNPEIRSYINEGAEELYDLLVAARGQEFFRKPYTFSTNSQQAAYALPEDFYQLISVDIYLSPNMVLTAHPYMEAERNRFRWYPGWFYNMPVYYRLLGAQASTGAALQPSTINFIPAPTSITTVTLNYVPAFRKLATDATEDSFVFDGINGWEGFVTWRAAAICLEKMQKDSSYARSQMEAFRARIEALAVDRHAGDPERIHDVASDYSPWGQP